MLLFQIQRVKYDTESWELYKDNRVFRYPKVLYPDRFLFQNRETGILLRKRYLDLKHKIKQLEIAILRFEDYKGIGIDIPDMIDKAKDFFEDQQKHQNDEFKPKKDGIVVYYTEKIASPSAKTDKAKLLLEKLSNHIKEKIMIMQTQLEKYKVEIETLFDTPDMTQNEYNLHSIMIHSGQAQGGHYYAYVFDAEYEK